MKTGIGHFLRRAFALLALLLASSLAQAQNNAAFVSQSVPATMVSGQKYNVSITLFNNGTNTWSPTSFQLGSQSPANNQTWGLSRVPVLTYVARGKDNYTFAFEVTAPLTAGTYNFQWKMIQGTSGWFGAPTTNVAVAVVGPPTISASQAPSPLVAGQPFTLTWNTTDATSVTRNCTASGTGFSGSATMPTVSGTSNATASAAWVGYPSTCTWTATGLGGSATYTQTVTTSAAPPTVSVSRTPSPMVAGQSFTLTWNTTDATSVTRSCTASGTGFTGSSTMPTVSGTSTGTASAAWVGYPSSCTWTATGAGGTAAFTETMTTVALPTISVTRTPSPMVAGQSYTLSWNSANTTSVTRSCTASGTGFAGNSTMPTASGTSTGTADPAWVGYPSTCTWTAAGSGGSATFTETMTTASGAPTISVSRTPSPMVPGQSYTLTWNTTNATSVARSCTASGTGFSGSATMPTVSGTSTGTADPAWAGYPSTCTWTATGTGGTATFTETMTTSPPATITVSRTPSTMVAGQGYTLTWSSTDASSVSRSCTSTGTGFAGSSTLAVSGTSSGTADPLWVGYPSTCTWTTTGSGGTATFTETMTTSAAAPTISVSRTPSTMVAGQSYTLTWNTTSATSVTRSCTASGTGFSGSSTMPTVSGTSTGSADPLWVGYPSACTWTATGSGGTATFTETMTTSAAPPTISVSRSPSTMVAGQGYTLTWNTANATSVTRSCTASGTGYSGSATMPTVSGTSTGTPDPAWVGYPSTCTWTATGDGGTATFTETMRTSAPATITVSRTPSPMVAGQGYTLTWSSTNASSVSRNCTAPGTGFAGNSTFASNGSSTGTADPLWVGYPSSCTWTATGSGGSATFTETMTTSPAAPTISASRTPSPMVAGQSYTLTWNATSATSVTRSCTANGTGFSGSATMPTVSGTSTGSADPSWVGYPSTCTWTATGSGGTTTFTETMTTSAAPPTISVSRTPSPMVAGQSYTLTWNSTNATSVARTCTASGTGFTDNSAMPTVSGTSTGTAQAAWAGYPSTCTWTASGAGGTATYTETMTTAPPPTISASRTPSPMAAGQSYTLSWNSTNATSVTR
ncbi:hypothetical protein, partial [Ramlibacter sp.]|uniref:hypothetical protein n=1 Tax=Ramlibacter sp. TaxID=1917967 RepID=UPI00184B889C